MSVCLGGVVMVVATYHGFVSYCRDIFFIIQDAFADLIEQDLHLEDRKGKLAYTWEVLCFLDYLALVPQD